MHCIIWFKPLVNAIHYSTIDVLAMKGEMICHAVILKSESGNELFIENAAEIDVLMIH